MDEMRAGTRTTSKRGWTPKGFRPICPIKIGYEFVYLYLAIFPATGVCFGMLLPRMNKLCFGLFMEQLQQYFPAEKIKLVVDRAGAHQRDQTKNIHIDLLYLPAASPELNGTGHPAGRAFFSRDEKSAC